MSQSHRIRLPLHYAGRRRRFFAFFIDFIILVVVSGLAALALSVLGVGVETLDPENAEWADVLLDNAAPITGWGAAFAFAYFFLMTAWRGATIGKLTLGLRVVNAEGRRPDLGPLAVREIVARALAAIAVAALGPVAGETVGSAIVLITIILILFEQRRQGVHDRVARTYVVLVEDD